MNQKKRVFSGVQPSGDPQLGNYLGAFKGWVERQSEKDNFFCIVDLHALTINPDPSDLKNQTRELAAILFACGLDPNKSTLFIQSHVKAHAEGCWLLNCVTPVGWLERMTQFKDKSEGRERVSAGLLDYPVLMAGDIILYDADERKGSGPDFGIRIPDNLDWADDGFIYVQEDPAKKVMPWFGSQSKQEASIWKFHPDKGTIQRIAQINRSVSLIGHTTDSSPAVMGAWESSGILDVTQLFDALPGERLLLATVQAGTVYDGLIKEANLVEGGQLVFLSRQGE